MVNFGQITYADILSVADAVRDEVAVILPASYQRFGNGFSHIFLLEAMLQDIILIFGQRCYQQMRLVNLKKMVSLIQPQAVRFVMKF